MRAFQVLKSSMMTMHHLCLSIPIKINIKHGCCTFNRTIDLLTAFQWRLLLIAVDVSPADSGTVKVRCTHTRIYYFVDIFQVRAQQKYKDSIFYTSIGQRVFFKLLKMLNYIPSQIMAFYE